MNKLSIIRSPIFQEHLTPPEHPESPERVAAIDHELAKFDLSEIATDVEAKSAEEEVIAKVHSPAYIERLARAVEVARKRDCLVSLDPDTYISPRSYEVAKLGVGGGLASIDSLVSGDFNRSFVVVRPPGHHAVTKKHWGFCLFNNIAVAARYALNNGAFKRVMILDWDVHHGNGSQEIFYRDPNVCVLSLHQYPYYPYYSGALTEDGEGDGKGFNINVPLPRGTGDRGYLAAWDEIVKPIVLEYMPDLILVSAGYDAHIADPMGGQRLTTVGFAMLSQRLRDLAEQTGAKVSCFLEGGYDLHALGESAVATMRVLSANSAEKLAEVHMSYIIPHSASGVKPVTGDASQREVDERIRQVGNHYRQYWPSL